MISGLDHVVVLLEDIKAGQAAYETLLGRLPSWQNSGDGAERVLFTLDNTTLELMAPHGFSVAADRIRNVIKIWGEGLASVCFATPDIAKMQRRLDRVALKPDPIVEVESRDQVRHDPELGAAERRRHRVAAERDRIGGSHMLFVAGRHVVGNEGDVDIGLSDKESLHKVSMTR